jgi:hypothetical protein
MLLLAEEALTNLLLKLRFLDWYNVLKLPNRMPGVRYSQEVLNFG